MTSLITPSLQVNFSWVYTLRDETSLLSIVIHIAEDGTNLHIDSLELRKTMQGSAIYVTEAFLLI